MTIKELYKWARDKKVENLKVGLQFQDSGGEYDGDTYLIGEDVGKMVSKTPAGEDYIVLY